jgi:hypothetical protein
VNEPGYAFRPLPLYVGWYQIGGPGALQVHVFVRPRWLTRVMVRFLLQWEWHDAKP